MGGVGLAVLLFGRMESARGVRRQLWGLNQQNFQEFERKLKARKLPRVDDRFAGHGSDATPPEVAMDPKGGFASSHTRVVLSAPGREEIRYTLDGSIPDHYSAVYTGPLSIESTTVVRARILKRGLLPGPTVSGTYFLEPRPGMPVVSLVMDPVTLWNKYSGIYENPRKSGEEWERPVDFEVLRAPGQAAWISKGRIRVHGGYSRTHPKKSFRLRYPVLDRDAGAAERGILVPRGVGRERTVVLRAGGSNSRHRLRDELFSALYRRSGGIASGFEPVTVYLNGAYWGIYDAREYVDGDFLEARFGPGKYELLAFDSKHRNDWATSIIGKKKAWKETVRFFQGSDLTRAEAYAKAGELLDFPSLIDYWAHNVYAANIDWPYNNMTVFRKVDGDGRWRWISWDADATFDFGGGKVGHATLEWAIRDRIRNDLKHNYEKGLYEDEGTFLVSTLFMRKLLANPEFKSAFVTRFTDLLNTEFRPERVEALLDSILALSRSDLPRDWKRWGLTDSSFRADQGLMRGFIHDRPAVVRSHLERVFGLGEAIKVDVAFDTAWGSVRVNEASLPASPWSGGYYRGMRLRFTAVPRPGFAFKGWTLGSKPSTDPVLETTLDNPLSLRARFAPAPFKPAPVKPETGAVPLGLDWIHVGDSETGGRAEGAVLSPGTAFKTIFASTYARNPDLLAMGISGQPLAGTKAMYNGRAEKSSASWVHFQESGNQNLDGQRTPAEFGGTFLAMVRTVRAGSPKAVISTETAYSFRREAQDFRDWTEYNSVLRAKVAALQSEGIRVHIAEVDRNIKDLVARIGFSAAILPDGGHFAGVGNLLAALSIYDALGYDVTKLDLGGITEVTSAHKAICLEIIAKR
ncbi:MAG: Por secretion system C-terminal sorting protein [Fibrobacteres bacterium]|nr:Por secretion system C-terminal sorting protein [Fibrobacterota bacterium]